MAPINKVDSKYSQQGYKIHNQFSIECLGCGKDCVEITVVDKGAKYPDQTVQVVCQRCGQLSFKKSLGQVKIYYDAVGDFKITDIQFLDNLLLFEVK